MGASACFSSLGRRCSETEKNWEHILRFCPFKVYTDSVVGNIIFESSTPKARTTHTAPYTLLRSCHLPTTLERDESKQGVFRVEGKVAQQNVEELAQSQANDECLKKILVLKQRELKVPR